VSGPCDGDGPNCGAEKTEKSSEQADALGGGRGLQPQIAGYAETDDEKRRKKKWKQAQGKNQTSGGGRRPRFGEAKGGFG
jgi:hypothetical protein